MGHLAVLILAGVILVVAVDSLLGGAEKLPTGKLPEDRAKPPGQPSADAPTPANSTVETPAQVEEARKHTPPA